MKIIENPLKRIENIEYYTSLSLLEKEAEASVVASSVGVDSLFNPKGDRFKNGIVVDPFAGHSVGDVKNADYWASIDFEKRELRPPFETEAYKFDMRMRYNNENYSNNVIKTGSLVTGIVIDILESHVIVHVGLKSEAAVQIQEFYNDYTYKSGYCGV